jgi:serine-type D-Ala-D-Ala carboxypeptidase/endopeptidase (penicillin-binding protein 4)
MQKGFRIKVIFSILVCLWSAAAVSANLTARVNAVIGRKSCKNVDIALQIVDASTGRCVYRRNADKLMIPASNMKILTSAAAIDSLGPDYKFTTKVGLAGSNLIIIGAGDPLLGDMVTDDQLGRKPGWVLDDIIAALKEMSVDSVNDIIIDTTFFDDQRLCPNWPVAQLNQPYACEVSGLNYNANCLKFFVSRSSPKPHIRIEPVTAYVKYTNQVRLTSKGSSAVGAYRTTVPNKLILKGKCRKEASFDVAIERPAGLFGFMLAEYLADAGIDVCGNLFEKSAKAEKKIKILRTYTTDINAVLIRCNRDSFTLAAESLVKTMSAEANNGSAGSWTGGFALMKRYLQKCGADTDGIVFDDGGGLSRVNRLSPASLTKVIANMYHSRNYKLFKETLAVGGIDGTIAKYFKEKKYRGRIVGKTGYINKVRTFSGICTTDKGDYIFSIMTEGGTSKVRTAINDIAKAIIDENEKQR